MEDAACRKPDPEDVRRILLVETTRFGDLMAALSTLDRFTATFPRARCTLLIHTSHASIIPALDIPCDVIPFPWPEDPVDCLGTLLDLHERRFDLAFCMSPSRKNAWLTLLSAACVRSGYLFSEPSLTPHLQTLTLSSTCRGVAEAAVPAGANLYKRATQVADQLDCVGIPSRPFRLDARLEKGWAGQARELGIVPGDPFVVAHPFATWEYRAWPQPALEEFSRMLREGFPEVRLVILGTPEDLAGLRMKDGPRGAGPAMCAARDWARTALLLAHATLFIGTDSGPLHLAAALGTTCIGLYGPASPEHTAPPAAGGRMMYTHFPCSPCDQRGCIRPDDPCMRHHTPEDVFRTAATMLTHRSPVAAHG